MRPVENEGLMNNNNSQRKASTKSVLQRGQMKLRSVVALQRMRQLRPQQKPDKGTTTTKYTIEFVFLLNLFGFQWPKVIGADLY